MDTTVVTGHYCSLQLYDMSSAIGSSYVWHSIEIHVSMKHSIRSSTTLNSTAHSFQPPERYLESRNITSLCSVKMAVLPYHPGIIYTIIEELGFDRNKKQLVRLL
jgi:hypothetical protein